MLTFVVVTPIAIEAISWKYFMIFVICDVVFIIIFYLFFPETKNKSLEEIGAIFGDEVSLNVFDEYRRYADCICSLLRRSKKPVSIWTILRRKEQTSTRISITTTRLGLPRRLRLSTRNSCRSSRFHEIAVLLDSKTAICGFLTNCKLVLAS